MQGVSEGFLSIEEGKEVLNEDIELIGVTPFDVHLFHLFDFRLFPMLWLLWIINKAVILFFLLILRTIFRILFFFLMIS